MAIVIRPWEPRDRVAVERLLRLFDAEAEVAPPNDAPTYVAAPPA